MDEKPTSIWKKTWKGKGAIAILSLLVALAVFLVALIYALANWEKPVADTLVAGAKVGVIFVACGLFVFFAVLPLARWLFWKHWRRTLFGLACLGTLIALFYAEENWRGRHDWEKFKREWEAKGEHFDYASVIPPPVPDEQNFALTPIVYTSYGMLLTRDGKRIPYEQRDTNLVERMRMTVAHNDVYPTNSAGAGNREKGQLTDLKVWQNYYRDLAAKTNEFPVPPQPQSPAADVLFALGKYHLAIEELREAVRLPCSRFPLNYDTECPAAILLPHLTALKQCSRVLQLRSIAELQIGQPEKALADVTLALQLTDKVRTEPFLITHLVRIAMLQIALLPVWEGLAAHQWSDAQLGALDAELAKLDFLADYGLGMRGERGMDSGIIDYLRHAHNQLQAIADLSSDCNANKSGIYFEVVALAFGPSGWYDQSKLRMGRFFERWYLRVADEQKRVFSPTAAQSADAALQAEIKHWNPCRLLEVLLLPALGNWSKKCAYAQSSVDLARLAMALERYRLAHGAFPESLDALAPKFIATVPHDVVGGQPLHYRREADGQFTLYSIGWNEKDDGGVVAFSKSEKPSMDISHGDWVWRYPQK